MGLNVNALDVILGAYGLYLFKKLVAPGTQRLPLPPGPKPLPLLGNLLDLPQPGTLEWLHWAKHKDLYGPISSVTVFGQSIIILNDMSAAFELFEKRSATFSDRPRLVFGGEMVGWDQTLALIHYGDLLRAYRKNIHQFMGTRGSITRFHKHEETEMRRFLLRLLKEPTKLQQHIRKVAGAIILKLSHGYTVEALDRDPFVDLADETVEQFSAAVQAGAWLVDVLPFLRHLPEWLPGMSFKRTARAWREQVIELVEKPHAFVKQQMAAGTASPSYTSELLEKGVEPGSDEDFVIKYSAASLYSGGADTTVSAMYSFFLAMVKYPEVQKRAQAELDKVIGSDRLPSFTDRERLPYIDALVKETLRWNPVAGLGLPHVPIEDSTYNGYFIPKGSVVFANIWQITHDPDAYHDPMQFIPERFLGVNGRKPEPDTHDINFGFGRRICPGKELADASLFISIAMSLSVFHIVKEKGDNGLEIEPICEYTPGVISHPKEFKCAIQPRSEKAVNLILSVENEHPWEVSDAESLKNLEWR